MKDKTITIDQAIHTIAELINNEQEKPAPCLEKIEKLWQFIDRFEREKQLANMRATRLQTILSITPEHRDQIPAQF